MVSHEEKNLIKSKKFSTVSDTEKTENSLNSRSAKPTVKFHFISFYKHHQDLCGIAAASAPLAP